MAQQDAQRECLLAEVQRKDREITLREAQLQKLQFEIARFKHWRFGARAEAMTTDQRRLFEETRVEDKASPEARLQQLREQGSTAGTPKAPARRPRREALPEHL